MGDWADATLAALAMHLMTFRIVLPDGSAYEVDGRVEITQEHSEIRTISSRHPLTSIATGPTEISAVGVVLSAEHAADGESMRAPAAEAPHEDRFRRLLARVVHEYEKEYGAPLESPPSGIDQAILDASEAIFEKA